jgi:hypothetical protein
VTKTYRYRLIGPPLTEFLRKAGVTPVVVTNGNIPTVDYQYDDSHKEDVDEFMEANGYEFMQEVP